jgi:ribonuclease BN (tRNA processing enzyme)
LKIKILGAHNAESKSDRLSSFLVDDVLAVDAGSLTSELTFDQQAAVKAILLTHGHYDHIRAVPAFAFNNSDRVTKVVALHQTIETLLKNLMDDNIYPDFSSPTNYLGKTVLELIALGIYQPYSLEGYTVTAFPVNHPVPAAGLAISDSAGKTVFFTGDTGPGFSYIWESISPGLIVAELTFPNRMEQAARDSGHLCPELLKAELLSFQQAKGYLPSVLAVHISPRYEQEIRIEAHRTAVEIGTEVEVAKEGQEVKVY